MELLNIFLKNILYCDVARRNHLSFKTKFNLFVFRLTTVIKQLWTASKIFKATALTYFNFSEGIEKVR